MRYITWNELDQIEATEGKDRAYVLFVRGMNKFWEEHAKATGRPVHVFNPKPFRRYTSKI